MTALDLDTNWMAHAACRGVDPELFYPQRGESTRAAKAVCAACPVSDDCLDHAIATSERTGIWGGLSEHERRPHRRERNRAHRQVLNEAAA